MKGTTRKRNILSPELWGFHPDASTLVLLRVGGVFLSSAAAMATLKMMRAMLMMTAVMVVVITSRAWSCLLELRIVGSTDSWTVRSTSESTRNCHHSLSSDDCHDLCCCSK